MMGDETIVNAILEGFLKDLPEQISTLKKAIEENDLEQIKLRAHTLKGSAANCSALALQEIAKQIESSVNGCDCG